MVLLFWLVLFGVFLGFFACFCSGDLFSSPLANTAR